MRSRGMICLTCCWDRYDLTFAQLKDNLRDKDKEISELKITISEMETRSKRESSRVADVEATWQVRRADGVVRRGCW